LARWAFDLPNAGIMLVALLEVPKALCETTYHDIVVIDNFVQIE